MNTPKNPSDYKKYRDIIRKNPIGVISTSNKEYRGDSKEKYKAPQSSTIMAAIDDDFSLYILIKTGSRKYNNIMYNSSVSFVFTDLYEFETLQIEAIAQEEFDLDTEIKYIEKLQCIMAKMGRANLPSQKIKKGKFIVIKAIPYWVRYGNFGHGESFDVFKKIIDTQPQ